MCCDKKLLWFSGFRITFIYVIVIELYYSTK